MARSLSDQPETLLFLPAEPLALAEELGTDAPALETPVLLPVDLSRSHGTDITAERIEELAATYDPHVESATLNFDHAWGGPSYGSCERLWVQDGLLWARYVNLAPDAVEGIRSGRYTRRSAEITLQHPVTGGWYFTGLALLGNARPAVPGLPPLQLRTRYVVITGAAVPQEDSSMAVPPEAPATQPAPPPAAAETPAAVQLADLDQLRAGVALVAQLRRQNAELQADKAIQQLGARVTPAMRRTLQPLLVHLMAQDPQTVKLAHSEGSSNAAVEKDVPLVDAFLQILAAVPSFEALNLGRLADDDGATGDTRSADEIALHSRHKITPERAAELRAKYQEDNN